MNRLVIWVAFLFLLYALLATVFFYVTHSQAILEFDRLGLYRLAFLCFAVFGCYKLGAALLKTRPRAPAVAPPRDDLAVLKGGVGDDRRNLKEHPLRVAFQGRPALTALLVGLVVVFAVSLPFLLELASIGGTRRFDATQWRRIFVGETVVAVAFVIAWYRMKHSIWQRRDDGEAS
jgi:hypothetical protein